MKWFVSSKGLTSPNVFMRRHSHHYPEKQYITMETPPLRPLPLCHHRCQSWKNPGSLCALWYLWLCNRKGHQYPTDPFRETGITTETKNHKWREWERTVPKPNQNKTKRFQNLTFLHRLFEKDWFHIFQEPLRRLNENNYSSFEATVMEKITINIGWYLAFLYYIYFLYFILYLLGIGR